MRSNERDDSSLRPLEIIPGFTKNADGSALISFGNTRVICTAFLEEKVPPFLRNQKKGWINAEYGMLPGSTHTRSAREAARGKQSGRTVEISRLIGRSLRQCVDMSALGECTVTVDCDVIQADGGTRTASISGGFVALALCLWKYRSQFKNCPLIGSVAAVSIGVTGDRVLVDLDYQEDSSADADLNLVMNQQDRFVEIQGTAEGVPFSQAHLMEILAKGSSTIRTIRQQQMEILKAQGLGEKWLS